MENLIIDNILLSILIPFWIFLIIMGGRFFSVYVNKIIIYLLTILGSFYGALISLAGLRYLNSAYEYSIPFLKIHDFGIQIGIHADKLSLIFAFLLFGISFCVQIFSVSYMKDEKKNYRFFALLNLFNFAMSALLFSPNLYQMYVFWEIAGIVSYLLIGFDYSKEIKSNASKKVFLVNRVGDTALIAAIILTTSVIYNYSGNLSFVTLEFSDLNTISAMLMGYTSTPLFFAICSLFILEAIIKSAQYPFHIWLQDAMEAKVPVSALLHSATIVAAGIYLVLRIMPFLTLNTILLKIVLVLGIITVVICPILACIETNSKKILAYSTSANLGLVFVSIGLQNIKAALILMAAHAVIKSALFLSLPKREKISYITLVFFVISALSLAGIILAGVPSKEYLYCSLNSKIMKVIFIYMSFLTAFYVTRLSFLIWNNTQKQKSFAFAEFLGTFLLIIMNILLYLAFRRFNYVLGYPFIASITAIVSVLLFNKFDILTKYTATPKISEYFLYNITPKLYSLFAIFLYKIERTVFYNYKPFVYFSKVLVKISRFIEFEVFNKSLKIFTCTLISVSRNDSVLQKKNVQVYNAYALMLVTLTLIIVTVAYILIYAKIYGR